jgi:hypothetical protein
MSLAPELTEFVDAGLKYDFLASPDMVRTLADAEVLGINCVSLASLCLKKLYGFDWPDSLFCYEAYCDDKHFEEIDPFSDCWSAPRIGDLFFFGHERSSSSLFKPQYDANGWLINYDDSPAQHLGIATGEQTVRPEPLILHASFAAGTAVVEPLSGIKSDPCCARVNKIMRLRGL